MSPVIDTICHLNVYGNSNYKGLTTHRAFISSSGVKWMEYLRVNLDFNSKAFLKIYISIIYVISHRSILARLYGDKYR